MALSKSVTEVLANKTAAAGSYTTLSDCTTIDTDAATSLAIEVKITYDASSNAAAVVKVFDSSDNSTFDTNPMEQFDCSWNPGASISQTFNVTPGGRYLKVRIDNGDTALYRSLTAIYVYSHLQAVS